MFCKHIGFPIEKPWPSKSGLLLLASWTGFFAEASPQMQGQNADSTALEPPGCQVYAKKPSILYSNLAFQNSLFLAVVVFYIINVRKTTWPNLRALFRSRGVIIAVPRIPWSLLTNSEVQNCQFATPPKQWFSLVFRSTYNSYWNAEHERGLGFLVGRA